jgi:hypothetical protein
LSQHFLDFSFYRWGEATSAATNVHIVYLQMMSMENDGGMILTGENRRTLRKTCPSATLSTTNPTLIDPVANRGLRGERPATNHLSHGTALFQETQSGMRGLVLSTDHELIPAGCKRP